MGPLGSPGREGPWGSLGENGERGPKGEKGFVGLRVSEAAVCQSESICRIFFLHHIIILPLSLFCVFEEKNGQKDL